jgi:polyphosphate kinase
MPRNFIRRVEVAFPIEDPALRDRIVDEILAIQLADNVKARVLLSDGRYERPPQGPTPLRSQERFMALARRAGTQELPVAGQELFPPSGRRPARRRKKRL